jgi:hypothetical protein
MWTILPYLYSHVSNINTVSVRNCTVDRTSYSRPMYNTVCTFILNNLLGFRGPGSSVCIATDFGLVAPASNSCGAESFRPSRPALGPTQPPVQWYWVFPGGKVRPGRAADHSPLLVPRSWTSRAITLPTLWVTPGL